MRKRFIGAEMNFINLGELGTGQMIMLLTIDALLRGSYTKNAFLTVLNNSATHVRDILLPSLLDLLH